MVRQRQSLLTARPLRAALGLGVYRRENRRHRTSPCSGAAARDTLPKLAIELSLPLPLPCGIDLESYTDQEQDISFLIWHTFAQSTLFHQQEYLVQHQMDKHSKIDHCNRTISRYVPYSASKSENRKSELPRIAAQFGRSKASSNQQTLEKVQWQLAAADSRHGRVHDAGFGESASDGSFRSGPWSNCGPRRHTGTRQVSIRAAVRRARWLGWYVRRLRRI